MMNNPNKWYSVPNVQADSISCVKWSASAPDILASGAWDGEIRVWQVATNPSANEDMNRFHANPVLALKHGAPVLCLAINKVRIISERISFLSNHRSFKLTPIACPLSAIIRRIDCSAEDVTVWPRLHSSHQTHTR